MNEKVIVSQIEKLLSSYNKLMESNSYSHSNIKEMREILKKIQKSL